MSATRGQSPGTILRVVTTRWLAGVLTTGVVPARRPGVTSKARRQARRYAAGVVERTDPGAATPPLAIRLRGVVKRYRPITAVDGLDLEVPEGRCIGLLGPNGAGKST